MGPLGLDQERLSGISGGGAATALQTASPPDDAPTEAECQLAYLARRWPHLSGTERSIVLASLPPES